MAAEVMSKKSGIEKWHPAVALVVEAVILFFVRENTKAPVKYTAILVGVYCLCVFLFKVFKKKGLRVAVCTLACILSIGELEYSMYKCGLTTFPRAQYLMHMADNKELVRDIRLQDPDLFYRIELNERAVMNDSLRYRFHGATLFQTLSNIRVSNFYKSYFLDANKNYYKYDGETPLISSMLSAKYLISERKLKSDPLYRKKLSINGMHLYENEYYLPLGYVIPEEVNNLSSENREPDAALNRLGYKLGAGEAIITRAIASFEKKGKKKEIVTVHESGYYYYLLTDNEETRGTHHTNNALTRIGFMNSGDSKKTITEGRDLSVYKVDLDSVDVAYQTLAKQTMDVKTFSETYIRGSIQVTEPGHLLISIPYEKGWKLKVNGKETQMDPAFNCFLGVSLDEGDYDIELEYSTPGFWPGVAISVLSLVMAVLSLLRNRYAR